MEIFKDIPNYEGIYQVSNYGNIKSLKRKGRLSDKILSKNIESMGYYMVNLSKNGKLKPFKVHQLVAITFLGHTPDSYNSLIVDHINNIKTDNRVENLQLTTARINTSKDTLGKSKYTGVSWYSFTNKWRAGICINGVRKHLGYFNTELEAHNKYQQVLNDLK